MKNKFINKNLYIEGLHQLKNPFIIMLVIMISSSILFPVLSVTDSYYYDSYSYINIIKTNGFLAIIPYICAPIFAFLIYTFLFKRKSSDFYHSLAFKRTTLFVSFTAAAATMLTVLILISILTTSITIASFSAINNVYIQTELYYSIIPTALNLIAASMLSVIGISIGCAVSGRFFPALITAAIILFCPRIFMGLIMSAFKSANYIINNSHFDIPLGNGCNALTGAVFNNYSEYKSVIYSLILALIYFVIAVIIFNKRKSETAANMSMNKIPQAIIRTVFSMIFCLPATLIAYTEGFTDNISLCLVFWFFGILAYFLFEIITQHSIKTLLSTLIQFVFVIILNIAILGGLYLAEYTVESYKPDEKTLQSVKISQKSFSADNFVFFWYEYYDDESDYQNYKNIINYEIKNDKIEKILCEALETTKNYVDRYSPNYYEFTVSFKDNNSSIKYRNVTLTESEYNKICTELAKDDEFIKAVVNYPKEVTTVDINYFEFYDSISFYSTTEPKCFDLYNKAIEELQDYVLNNKDNKIKKRLIDFNLLYDSDDYYIGNIVITDKQENDYIMPIYPEMKETVKLITELSIDSNENKANIYKALNNLDNNKWTANISYTKAYASNKSYTYTDSCKIKDYKNIEEFKEYIKNIGLKKQEDSVIIKINMQREYEDDDEYIEEDCFDCCFYLDESAFQKYLEP